ncbi:MAG: nitrate/nitrite transporter [Pelagibacteraceae bacterium]|jgi:NNP family nitrate/nitrite transporter-like MFS transporter|nr:MFS transporter [Candidatus Pelagibacter sp.]MDP6680600.1 nitrate/nitrite transporter [Pelagibacteraceae bacterium]MDP6710042.1 nitrate/nitrite transporter [Pelagibacteraceae bacterium]
MISKTDQTRALTLSTLAFTVCFAIWTIFSILGIQIKQDLGLNDTQFGLLVATPILTGALSRLILGIWTDQYGGRNVMTLTMLLSAIATYLLSSVETYEMFLVAALGVGLAGGCFAAGIAYVSTWYEKEKQGTALGIFGVGNVGAAFTNFGAPFIMLALGWHGLAKTYAIIMFVTAILFYLLAKDDPNLVARRKKKEKPRSILQQLQPLKKLQVWRFSLYYFFVFGGFVALALWLPRYYVGVYGLDIKTAGMLAAAYALPGSAFRALGGWISDKIGARAVMYWTFIACVGCCFFMSYPTTHYIVEGIEGPINFSISVSLPVFVLLSIVLGFFMSLGKAAVYKHIPVYYPKNVGSVGGIVGLIGGLGGFILPICFGIMNDLTGVFTSCFMLLFAITAITLVWMHVSILFMEKDIVKSKFLPELNKIKQEGESKKSYTSY